ncbi:MAG TPA: ATP-binding protein [Cyclobacteriaceae bacterium]|jgi:signal transduction histidine kinase/ligand-binding sensor domain-containing protein|nr:ATP-binding protein [Cyclobacteriaceae bacterium]
MQNGDMAQDKQGTLYFANTNGVLIFDGIHWEVLELPGKAYVRSFGVDQNDKVYVGAEGEFGYLQRTAAGNFKYISLLSLQEESIRHTVNSIIDTEVLGKSVFFNDENHSYIYKNGKIDVLDKESLSFLPLGDSIYAIKNKQSALYIYRNNEFARTDLCLGPNDKIRNLTTYKGKSFLVLDDKNRIWLLDPNAGPKDKVLILSENLNTSLRDLPIRRILPLHDGRLSILTDDEIIIADVNGEILYKITRSMLGGSNLQDQILYEDAQHNLWFTTDEFIGLVITSSPLTYYDKTNGFNGIVMALGEQGGQRYVGTNSGLYCQKDNNQFQIIPGTTGMIWGIYNLDHHLYIAHDDGIYEVVQQKATKLISHQFPMSLYALNKHRDCFIMGTYNSGIWLLKKNNAEWTKHKIKGFEEETRFIQEDDKGNLWISHEGKGIGRLRLNEVMDSVIDIKFYSSRYHLPSNINNRIFKLSDQKIIAATADGIYSYNESKNIFEPDHRFSKALHGIIIYSLAEAREGHIYFRGRDNVKEIAGVLTKGIDGTYSALLTPFNKITWADSDAPLLATQGGAWFGNNGRVIAYNLNHKTYYHEPLQPIIKKVIAGDSITYTNGTTHQTASIPYSWNSMLFDFDVMYYEDVEKNEFQYKLLGFDKEWSAWTSVREAHFTNLPEGDYTFLLRARNIYRNKSRVASIAFHINPPIYRTLWAYLTYFILITILFAILLYWLIRLKTKRVNRQKEILEREVREKTKELLVMNEEVKHQAEVLKASNYTKDKLFSIISHDMRGPIHQVREIFNMIESGYISADEFRTQLMPDLKERVTYVATLTDNLLHWARGQMEGIQVKPSVFNVLDIINENINLLSSQALNKSINLVSESHESFYVHADKDMIKLVLRNLISNAIKFTPENGTIEVKTRIEDGHARVSVRDTGTGLSPEDVTKILDKEYFTKYGTAGEKGSGLGLMLCREFIEKNEGQLTIESKLNAGSIFTFSLIIHKE